ETLQLMLVASPAYLAARGTPKKPADLASHDCIFGPGNLGRDSWSFSRNGTEIFIDVRGRIQTDSSPGTSASAMAGLGIAMIGRRGGGSRDADTSVARLQAGQRRRARGAPGRTASVDKDPRAGRLPGPGI